MQSNRFATDMSVQHWVNDREQEEPKRTLSILQEGLVPKQILET